MSNKYLLRTVDCTSQSEIFMNELEKFILYVTEQKVQKPSAEKALVIGSCLPSLHTEECLPHTAFSAGFL